MDNTGSSRPRVGLNQADVVYVEPVEGGLTRLLAIFSTAQATQVGPVRSARGSDVALLANYGAVAFAFSGASAGTLAVVGAGAQKNLVFDASRQGFRRDGGRPAPYDVIGSPSAQLPGPAVVRPLPTSGSGSARRPPARSPGPVSSPGGRPRESRWRGTRRGVATS